MRSAGSGYRIPRNVRRRGFAVARGAATARRRLIVLLRVAGGDSMPDGTGGSRAGLLSGRDVAKFVGAVALLAIFLRRAIGCARNSSEWRDPLLRCASPHERLLCVGVDCAAGPGAAARELLQAAQRMLRRRPRIIPRLRLRPRNLNRLPRWYLLAGRLPKMRFAIR
jgi:hypothetical protein